MNEVNWGGNVAFSAQQVHRPQTLAQAQQIVARADRLRVVGSRHSFSRIADGIEMLDPGSLPEAFEVASDRATVRVNGAMTYGRLAQLLAPTGLTIANFASLPHISIAGAVATGTHGSGRTNQNLGSAVRRVQLLTARGELVELAARDEGFDGAIVSLGALGLVTEVDLEVLPVFDVAQTVYEGFSVEDIAANVDALMSAAYSVSVFTMWRTGSDGDQHNQVWAKRRVGDEPPAASQSILSSLTPADAARHPIKGIDAGACTQQFGEPGAPVDRLPHFRLDFVPSSGEEIQSEFFVGYQDAAAAVRALASIGPDLADALMAGEIRTVAADSQWMSPHFGRDSLAFHFTWVPDQALAEAAARKVAEALSPFDVRPHWGKVFDHRQFDIAGIEHRDRFLGLVDHLDPAGTFCNDWFTTVIRNA